MQIRSTLRKDFLAKRLLGVSTANPAKSQATTVVSAYLDGKSQYIETLKLDAIERFETAQENSEGKLQVIIDGQRHQPKTDALLFAGSGLLPSALAGAAGWSLAGPAGALVGGAIGLLAFGLPASYFLQRALKAPQWQPEHRLYVNASSTPTPVSNPGPQRLRSLTEESRKKFPEARQILFLSGHGDRKEIAQMSVEDIGHIMQGSQLDATILDACLVGQLEVMSHFAPWAGLVLASPHKIKARGLEVVAMLKKENLEGKSLEDTVVDMAREAKSTTPSFAVVDTKTLKSELLPSLDKLGSQLAEKLGDPKAESEIHRALAGSLSTDGLFSRRVDLGSFLEQLDKQNICPEETKKARTAFQQTVPFQKNRHSLSFHLSAGAQETSLPEGWRQFLGKLDLGFKPWF